LVPGAEQGREILDRAEVGLDYLALTLDADLLGERLAFLDVLVANSPRSLRWWSASFMVALQ
jgi:hypothetical protein